ncbi:MAG: efflux RND transporter periplasmic adaptor subunit [Muribaculaceae bacterium]|nr:efflux RND transporter periplasmic adaptor subunit [Muribaculaceae bacterium]
MDREIPTEERRRQRNRKLLRWSAIAVALVVAGAGIYSFSRTEVAREKLRIVTVDRGDVEPSVAASGTVVPVVEEMIVCPINSQILEVLHQNGDAVEEGTPLLRLDTQGAQTEYQRVADELQIHRSQLERLKVNNKTTLDDLAMKIKVAAMKLDRLEAELRNERYLDSLGSGTHDKVKEAEFSCETSRIELEQLRQQLANERRVKAADEYEKQLEINMALRNLDEIRRVLDDARIRSPRKAVITYILDEVGTQVTQGSKVAVVSDLSHFKINGTIADTYGDYVTQGSKVTVRIGADSLDGVVGNVTPLSKDGTIQFTVVLEDGCHRRLRSGLKVDVYVISQERNDVLRIDNSSYYAGPGEYTMFVMAGDDMLEKRNVRLGDCSYDKVEVVDGLVAGERVVISDMKKYNGINSIKIK